MEGLTKTGPLFFKWLSLRNTQLRIGMQRRMGVGSVGIERGGDVVTPKILGTAAQTTKVN